MPLLVVLAAALVALAGSALAGLPSRASVSAADPAEGTFILDVLSRKAEHTIKSATFACMDKTGTCSGFEVFAAQQYRGTTPEPILSGSSRASDNPCVVPSGTLVGRFQFVRALNKDWRAYRGLWMQASESNGVCTLTGLGRSSDTKHCPGNLLYPVNLGEGADSDYYLGTGPIHRGPYNNLRITWDCSNDDVGGGSGGFYRKAGTYSTTPTTTTTKTPTTTTPYEGGDGDNEAPVVKALASKGKPGRIAQLRYSLDDDSGFAKDEVWVYKGKTKKVIWRWKNDDFDEVDGDVVFARWKVPATLRGIQKFCVRAADEDGAQSPWSCSTVKIT